MKIIPKILICLLLLTGCKCHAQELIAVLSGDSNSLSTYYYLYSDASNLIAQDLANEINKRNEFRAINMFDYNNMVKPKYRNINPTYKNTYIVDINWLEQVNKDLKANYILMISSGLDIQSHVLESTIWNKINIAGSDSFRPHYNLITYVSLIDMSNKSIIWQDVQEKLIADKDFSILNSGVSPSLVQLKEIKKYSAKLAPQLAVNTSLYIKNPPLQDLTNVKGVIITQPERLEEKQPL